MTGLGAVLALAALGAASPPAQARIWLSVGVPFPGYYYSPGPYYGYVPPYYAPQYYAPQSYAPPGAYYPPAGAYPPSPYAPTQSAYAPQSASIPSATGTNTAPAAAPKVTYTDKAPFINSAGQTCREYKTTDAAGSHPIDVFGTACKQPDGQWRVVN